MLMLIIGGKLCLLRKHLHLFTYLFQAFELAVLTGVALRLVIRGEYFDSVEAGFAKETHVEVRHAISKLNFICQV